MGEIPLLVFISVIHWPQTKPKIKNVQKRSKSKVQKNIRSKRITRRKKLEQKLMS